MILMLQHPMKKILRIELFQKNRSFVSTKK